MPAVLLCAAMIPEDGAWNVLHTCFHAVPASFRFPVIYGTGQVVSFNV